MGADFTVFSLFCLVRTKLGDGVHEMRYPPCKVIIAFAGVLFFKSISQAEQKTRLLSF
jgi:hypothetical protein